VLNVRRGSMHLDVQVVDSRGREVFRFFVDPINGKAMADTLGSACMVAKPRTGQRMDSDNWASVETTGKAIRSSALAEADLFSHI